MRTLKKTLCLVLALVMCLGMFTVASADNGVDNLSKFVDAADVNYPEAVDFLVAAGVVHGDNTNRLNPDGNITRAEAATLVAYMMLGKEAADAYKATEYPFTDVTSAHWAAGYIQFAEKEDYIVGMGDGTFKPDDYIKGIDMASMLLRLLGYGRGGAPALSYPAGVQAKALSLGMFDEVVSAANLSYVNRDKVFQMVFNTMTQIATVQYNASVGAYFTGTNFQANQVYCVNDVADADDWWNVTAHGSPAVIGGYVNTLGYKTANMQPEFTSDALKYYMREWENRRTGNTVTNQYPFYDVVVNVTATTNVKTLSKKIADTCKVYINGGDKSSEVLTATTDDAKLAAAGWTVKAAQSGYTVEPIDINGDGVADRIIVVVENLAQVGAVSAAKGDTPAKAALSVVYNNTTDTDPVSITANKVTSDEFAIVNTLKKDDIVKVIPALTLGTQVPNADPKSATVAITQPTADTTPISIETITPDSSAVTSFQGVQANTAANNTQSVTFGGATYNYSASAAPSTYAIAVTGGSTFIVRNNYNLNGSIYDFYLNSAGYIIGVTAQRVVAEVPNFIYVTAVECKQSNSLFGTPEDYQVRVRGYLVDGTQATFDLKLTENKGDNEIDDTELKTVYESVASSTKIEDVSGYSEGTTKLSPSKYYLEVDGMKFQLVDSNANMSTAPGKIVGNVFSYEKDKDDMYTLGSRTRNNVNGVDYVATAVASGDKLGVKTGDAVVLTGTSLAAAGTPTKLYATTSTNLVLVDDKGIDTKTGYASFPGNPATADPEGYKEYTVGSAQGQVTAAFYVTAKKTGASNAALLSDIVVIGVAPDNAPPKSLLLAYTGTWQAIEDPKNDSGVVRYEFFNGANGEIEYYPAANNTVRDALDAVVAAKVPTKDAVFAGTVSGPDNAFNGDHPANLTNLNAKSGSAYCAAVFQNANNWLNLGTAAAPVMVYQGELVAYDVTEDYAPVVVKENDSISFTWDTNDNGEKVLTAVFVVEHAS